jgi:hypothetical protein
MKMIGEAAINLRWLIVGGESFNYPEFFETGFKNFGASLKIFTLKNGCFENWESNNDDIHGRYVNSVDAFFKSLSETCPNLSRLNLGSAHQLRRVYTCNLPRDYEKLFSVGGFENVKELNVDFTYFHEGDGIANFNWYFGLMNDCNNVEILSLNGLMFPFFGQRSGDMASIKRKFKNLKQCQLSFQEGFDQYFEYTLCASLTCSSYADELAIDLDETFAGRSTEFKVLIPNKKKYAEEVKCFQIIKMPFKHSVITKL